MIEQGLARLSQKHMSSRDYEYPALSGKGVFAYVIDSGINFKHEEFEGRAKAGKTLVPSEGFTDGTGHGTHVAGTIGSRKYGVAKKVTLIAVKIFDKDGKSSGAGSIGGIEWALKDAQERQHIPGFKGAVANLSIGSKFSRARNEAVDKAVKAGLHVVVAAGNEHDDACEHSPASAEFPITVGATTEDDKLATFSNYGKCVDVLAPGYKILSAGNTGTDSETLKSGTSMATPHVAGLVAHFLSIYPSRFFNPPSTHSFSASALDVLRETLPGFLSDIFPQPFSAETGDIHTLSRSVRPSIMKAALKKMAWRDLIADMKPETPNLLVFNNYTTNDFWESFEDSFHF